MMTGKQEKVREHFVRISFDPVETDAIRLVVEKTWGGEKAHIFAIDVR